MGGHDTILVKVFYILNAIAIDEDWIEQNAAASDVVSGIS
jgi:hypothetical protein